MTRYTKIAFAEELVKAVRRLVRRGCLDPSAEDICREHYWPKKKEDEEKQSLVQLGPGMINDVSVLLSRIRFNLAESGIPAILLGPTYYNLHCEEIRRLRKEGLDQNHEDWPIKDAEEAMRCLAVGAGKGACGIYIPKQEDDRIFVAHTRLSQNRPIGQLRQRFAETQTAVDRGLFSDDTTEHVLKEARTGLLQDGGAVAREIVSPTPSKLGNGQP